ncbi:MAG: HAD-IA family hydrolase [Alphaproteobacteria bacterium]|nr:HAD-IA family hydrolase [Alphaproteobacteria bacterium]
MMPPRLAVFDVDGTLVDSQHNIIAAMTEAFRVHDLGTPRPEDVRSIIGLSLVEAVAALLPDAEPERHIKVARTYGDAFGVLRQRPDHSEPLFPGAVEALDALSAAGLRLGIATGKSRRGLRVMLDRTGLRDRFVTLQTADDGPGKPHPAMLVAAMAEAGVAPEHTAMIGDATFDMIMARAAGARAIGVGWGYHAAADLEQAGAETVVTGFGDLLPAVLRLIP